MTYNWRILDHDRGEFFGWANTMLRDKVLAGAVIHGDTFQGDPLDHAIEEALDSLFYLWMAKREQYVCREGESSCPNCGSDVGRGCKCGDNS